MKKEFDDELVKLCPNLYKDRYASIQTSCMGWGFDIGDGWRNIVKDLSIKLEKLILALPKDERASYCASQVKEKFSSLHFYMTSSTDEMEKLISEAEEKSAITCEVCGTSGKTRGKSWLYTACDEHTKEQDKK